MALPMTHDEIRMSYRDAKQKSKQIGILADLNACPRKTIEDIVKDIAPISKHIYKRIDDLEAYDMYKQGATNAEIADHFGVTKEAVKSWKRRRLAADEIQIKQEESEMPTPQSNIIIPPPAKVEQIQETPDNVQAMTSQEHDAAHEITLSPETVGERIDALLALRKATDSEAINKSFGDLCARILADAIGL